ncbi:MAG: YggS family pyridoxal phosphate-dependent enzyme [Flavobacteriales bacterium]|nr:YggS family pyridoxal phosphate-dependent enzyme [Flavobacteriales bacterium]
MSKIAEHISKIKSEIPEYVTLIAVSKTKSNEEIMEAYAAGQRDFGENYIQELCAKAELLPKDIRWHAIGHLQSNKVKYIAPFVHLIHGVDSLKLLQEIDKQAKKNNRIIPCLLQIYIASEESKFGLSEEEAITLLKSDAFQALNNVNITGVMGMASNTDDIQKIKSEFQGLKRTFEQLKSIKETISIISMGMSGDYLLAIEEGSTMIRVGSKIFGERNYAQQ